MPTPFKIAPGLTSERRGFFFLKRHPLTLFFLFSVGVFAYLRSFSADFQFDDYATIVENPIIKHLDIPLLWSHYKVRFLTNLTFAMNYWLGGLNVFGWHLVNNLIHVLNSFLVYLLTFITFRTPKLEGRFDTASQYSMALFSSLVFLVHPLQTQAVTYIVQRATSLSGLFYLGAMYFYVKARLNGRAKDYIWAMVFSS